MIRSIAHEPELYRVYVGACSRLYRCQIQREKVYLAAVFEIYKIIYTQLNNLQENGEC